MTNKPLKQKLKAEKIVQGAVGTFSKAIEEVEKANELLLQAVASDESELVEISIEITEMYKKLDVVQAEKINKNATIIQNKELIGKLEQFTR